MITRNIEIFLEVGESLCFAQAAKKFYTTQPTVSRQITALEDEWGVKLFVRSNKGLRLTPEGAIMLDCCRKMNRMCTSALKEAKEQKHAVKHRINLGFLETLDMPRILLPFLLAFAKEHPDVEVSHFRYSFGELRKGLANGKLDIIYTYDFDIQNMETEIVSDLLMPIKPMYVVSSSCPRFQGRSLTLRDLSGETFYLPGKDDAPGREADLSMLLCANKVSDFSIRFLPNLESVMFQIKCGKGVAMADNVSEAYMDEEFRIIEPDKYSGALNLMAVWAKDNLNPVIPMLVNEQSVYMNK